MAIFTLGEATKASRLILSEYQTIVFARTFIKTIVIANVLFIIIHLIASAQLFYGYDALFGHREAFRIDRDLSVPEFFNYVQAFLCGTFLLMAFRASKERIYLFFAFVFYLIVIDDALAIHENVGTYLDDKVELPAFPGLRSQDTGELMVWALTAAALAPLLVWAVWRLSPGAVGFVTLLSAIVVLLVAFAVGIDLLHVAFDVDTHHVGHMIGVIEDGGEMLALGIACSFSLLVYMILERRRRHDAGEAGLRAAPKKTSPVAVK